MANQFGKVSIGITASTGGLTAGLRRAGKEVSGFTAVTSKLRSINISTTFLAFEKAASLAASTVSGLTRSLSGLVESSVSLGEEQSKAGVIFGKSATEVGKFAKAASVIGLSESAALSAAGTFGNLFRAIGLSEQQSASFSTTMVSLASDLASFNNTTVDDALVALGAGLRGEAEPLRRYGVLLDDATLRQVAFKEGIIDSIGPLTPAQKAQAAYVAIMQQTTLAQGDFQRTSDSLANQQRILAAEFENVRAKIGDGLQPVFAAIVKAVRDSIPQITAAANQFAVFVGGLDVADIATTAVTSLVSLTQSLMQMTAALAPIVAGLLSPFFSGLMFIANNATGAATGLGIVVGALVAYRAAALAATVVNMGLATSFRALLSSTGVGIIVALIGAAAGSLLEYAMSSDTPGASTPQALGKDFGKELEDSTARLTEQLARSQAEASANAAANALDAAAATKDAAAAIPAAAAAAANSVAKAIGPSTEKLSALVVGSSSGESFRNAMMRGDFGMNDADRRIAENTGRTASGVEQLPTRIGLALGQQISGTSITV